MPVTQFLSVSLMRRNSTGSIASFTANSSTALSSAKITGISAGERMKIGGSRSARTMRPVLITAGKAYIAAAFSTPPLT